MISRILASITTCRAIWPWVVAINFSTSRIWLGLARTTTMPVCLLITTLVPVRGLCNSSAFSAAGITSATADKDNCSSSQKSVFDEVVIQLPEVALLGALLFGL